MVTPRTCTWSLRKRDCKIDVCSELHALSFINSNEIILRKSLSGVDSLLFCFLCRSVPDSVLLDAPPRWAAHVLPGAGSGTVRVTGAIMRVGHISLLQRYVSFKSCPQAQQQRRHPSQVTYFLDRQARKNRRLRSK